MRSRLALTVAIGATVLAGCAGSRSTWRPTDTRPVPAVVTKLLKGIAYDISEVSHKYPELSRWHLRETHGMGFRYEFRCKTTPHRYCMPLRRYGRHGCFITVWITRGLLDREGICRMMITPEEARCRAWIFEPVPDIDVTVQAQIEMSGRTSDGFMAEMTRIMRKHLDIMRKKGADPSAPHAPKAQ